MLCGSRCGGGGNGGKHRRVATGMRWRWVRLSIIVGIRIRVGRILWLSRRASVRRLRGVSHWWRICLRRIRVRWALRRRASRCLCWLRRRRVRVRRVMRVRSIWIHAGGRRRRVWLRLRLRLRGLRLRFLGNRGCSDLLILPFRHKRRRVQRSQLLRNSDRTRSG